MRISRLLRSGRIPAVAVIAGAALALAGAVPHAAEAAAGEEGASCLAGAGGSNTFDLTATTGYIQTPDGNTIFSWGYAGPTGTFQLPGPTLCVTSGEAVTVVLHNKLKAPTSIVFPGQVGVEADGQPAAPQFTANSTAAGSLVQGAAAKTTATVPSITYTFTAGQPGTYLYTSGTDQRLQKQMGLYGALIVRPAGADDQVYADPATTFMTPGNSQNGTLFRQEYLQILSEVDPAVHLAVERNRTVNWNVYKARYFLINGRSMPDTLSPNNAPYLPAQPYGATVHIRETAGNSLPAVLRYLNAGPVTYPFHPHGNSQKVIGRDGRELTTGLDGNGAPNGTDLAYDKFLIEVGPGQTVDTLLRWTNVENWNPTDGQIQTPLPNQADLLILGDSWWSQSPYLGFTSDLPAGVTSYNTCGEYYHVAHSHALQQSTNYGAAFGGMMTLIRIDPASANGC